MATNIILTGIPRAGTTLAAARLDAKPDTVCLNEPSWQHPHPALDAKGFALAIREDFVSLRQRLLAGEAVTDRRTSDGTALTNYYDTGTDNEMHERFVMYPLVRKGLSPNFTLAIKHNGPYLAVLPELIALRSFEIRAVIRHPLSVIRSWRRLALPVSVGEMPSAAPYWPELKIVLESHMDLLEKQVRMYELMLSRLLQHAHHITLMRYEDMRWEEASRQVSSQPTEEDRAILTALKQYTPRALEFYS